MDIVGRLADYWSKPGKGKATKASAVATEREIATFEEKYRAQIPADLRSYFLRLNGTDGDGDYQLFRFWPICELRPVDIKGFNLLQAGSYFSFADFMIESWYYAIYLGEDPIFQNRVVLPDFPTKPVIASTFTEFLELYLQDHPKLYDNV